MTKNSRKIMKAWGRFSNKVSLFKVFKRLWKTCSIVINLGSSHQYLLLKISTYGTYKIVKKKLKIPE